MAAQPFFERLAEDERILALGFCSEQDQLRYPTKLLPKSVTCERVRRGKTDTFATVSEPGRRIHVSAFPITAGTVTGHLLVLHDLAYIDERAKEARFYSVLALVGVAASLGLLATAVVLALMRAWSRSVRSAIVDAQHGGADSYQRSDFPISREVHAALSEMRLERRFANGIHVEWTPKTLQRLLVEELPGDRRFSSSPIASPTSTTASNGAIALQIAGEWPRLGARAGDARLRRNLDRARQRVGRSRNRRWQRSHCACRPPIQPTRCGASG